MTDTPDHIRKKQMEIWLSKPVEERFRLGMEFINLVHRQMLSRLREQHPEYTEGELKAAFVYELYKDDLPEDYLKDVMNWMRERHDS
ncbi:MAG: hypothetical protein N2044_05800 [Cyclobacteriaceae bacterium]|nr:hypothetical protein [Cyclobacteriaceae bacterium]MCX7637345.1 hypothetical protein [Cyclobacteriaceae bacterium]MDW8330428.1 hypothetical protein [Cyclobacteriaceae bacterium]